MWHFQHSFTDFTDGAIEGYQESLEESSAEQDRQAAEDEALRLQRQRATEARLARAERAKWLQPILAASLPTSRHILVEAAAESDARGDEYWSFRPLRREAPPSVANTDWPRNAIDLFILQRLRAAGLEPSREAPWHVLRRRICYDLTGLPPQRAPAASTTGDQNEGPADDYERLVDRLLSDPSFGERWARVWLDLARYADSNGYEEDELRPHAYTYRDFVIWAMNHDLPYDIFLRWQIAGDEVAAEHPLAVAATGFFTAAPYNTFMPQEAERYDELDDMVSTMGKAMLGLTLGCARCHDHKYDPITTTEYYGLVAFFCDTSRTQSYLVPDGGETYKRLAAPVEARRDELKQISFARIKEDNIRGLDYFTEAEKDLLRQPIDPNNEEQKRLLSLCERCLLITDEHLSDDLEPLEEDRPRYDRLIEELAELEPRLPPAPPQGLTLSGSNVARAPLLAGGNVKRKRGTVGPRFLSALTRGTDDWTDETWQRWGSGSATAQAQPRTALASWMTDVDQGAGALAARVIVNRLWQHHFGEGLVRTASNFGNEGEAPSHPLLLEWLACELVDSGWSLKHMHRLIVTSATYRQAAAAGAQPSKVDEANRLWGRRSLRRLSAEEIRDTLLACGGNLDRTLYGPAVKLAIPEEAVYHTQKDAAETWPTDVHADYPFLWRRSIYAMVKRTVPVPMLQLFDAPCGTYSCARRKETNLPTQALALWHAPFVRRQAARLAQRIVETCEKEHESLDPAQVAYEVFLCTLSRPPDASELRSATGFLGKLDGASADEQLKVIGDFCHVMFLCNEFIYVD